MLGTFGPLVYAVSSPLILTIRPLDDALFVRTFPQPNTKGIAMNTTHPGDAEAAAAATHLHEQTLRPISTGAHYVGGRLVAVYSVGDAVMYRAMDGVSRMGRIVEAANDDLYVIDSDDGHRRVVHAEAIYPF
jgi:hypothetical protein